VGGAGLQACGKGVAEIGFSRCGTAIWNGGMGSMHLSGWSRCAFGPGAQAWRSCSTLSSSAILRC